MKVTLSIDDRTQARAREIAKRRGMSDSPLPEGLTSERSPQEVVEELTSLWEEGSGNSAGRRWTREELHERSGLS